MFKQKNMSVIAYANGFTFWHYKATDCNLADVVKDGFFNRIWTLMAVGDLIIISALDKTDTYYVSQLDADNVILKRQGK